MEKKKLESKVEELLRKTLLRKGINPLELWYFNQVKNDELYVKNTAMDKRSIAGLFRTLILKNYPIYNSNGLYGCICNALNKDLKIWIEQGKVSEYLRKTKELKFIIEFADSWYRLNHEYVYPALWETEFVASDRRK